MSKKGSERCEVTRRREDLNKTKNSNFAKKMW